MATLKPVYEPDKEPAYRAECDLCDWWEAAMRFGEIRQGARLHMVNENLRSGHDAVCVTIWKVMGNFVKEIGPDR